MTKKEAIELFDGNASALARELGIKPPALAAWPDILTQKHIDRVVGAHGRMAARKQRQHRELLSEVTG